MERTTGTPRMRPSRQAAILVVAAGLWATMSSAPAAEGKAEAFKPPAGYHLVAKDNCGTRGQKHVVVGTFWEFPPAQIPGPPAIRRVVFHGKACVLRFLKPNPAAAYKVDVTYCNQAGARRVQRLEVNGREVHGNLTVPEGRPGRYVFDVPRAAYADGKQLEFRFINAFGANAVVAYVRIWSTDRKALGAPPASQRAAFAGRPAAAPIEPLWQADGAVEEDWSRQDRLRGRPTFSGWKDAAGEVRGRVLPCIRQQLQRGRRILADLRRLGARDIEPQARALEAAARKCAGLEAAGAVDPAAWKEAYLAARWAVRRLAFKNPLLNCDGLLFVRRHHPHTMHQCARRLGSFTYPGGGICVLDEIRPDGTGRVRRLTEGRFPEGVFGRPDLSFDGRRIVFGYAPRRDDGAAGRRQYGGISQHTAPLYAEHKVGPCHEFQVWQMHLDANELPARRLTDGPAENADPLYLPGGRIAFMSHRAGGLVQCGDWALAYCLFTMNADGADPRRITLSKDGEWDPSLLDDGTILFTRWEYMTRFWVPTQMLWNVRPDGTNPRVVYGSDLSRHYPYPLNYASARQIPGTSKVVCIGSAHHNTGAGPVCIVDLNLGREIPAGLERLTPVRYVETNDRKPHNGWYDCPYPLGDPARPELSGRYFLVSYSFAHHETDTTGYGIYLLDVYGGKELIYRDESLSALFPMPIRRRPCPGQVAEIPRERRAGHGEFLVLNVDEGLPASLRGRARYLRVVEAHERHIHTKPYDIQVGPDSGFETKTVLGTVPVEADGSAYFRVPADTGVFFAVLDANHQALHVMRMTTNVRPGERTSCIGCHEPMSRAPANRLPLAARRAPSTITPPPWGTRPMSFPKLVQPILDKHCIRCHDPAKPRKGGKSPFDLTASRTRPFMSVPMEMSYHHLRRYVANAGIGRYYTPPGSWGSGISRLTAHLAKGHNKVKLDPAEWRLLCAWIDCNAPYLDDYRVVAADPALRLPRK